MPGGKVYLGMYWTAELLNNAAGSGDSEVTDVGMENEEQKKKIKNVQYGGTFTWSSIQVPIPLVPLNFGDWMKSGAFLVI